MTLRVERLHCKPWGLAGGLEAAGNEVALRIDGKEIADLPNGKLAQRRLKAGDVFVYRAGGGGGFGPPLEREANRVAEDVRQGYVSHDSARDIYGVALLNDGTVDHPETARLRSRGSRGAAHKAIKAA